MTRGGLCLVLALVGCGTASLIEDPPVSIVADDEFGGGADYGVLELWEGPCAAPTRLRSRERFEADPERATARDPIDLTDGQTMCARLFAVVDEVETPPLTCSVIGRGEREFVPGVTTESPLVVPVEALSAERSLGLASERDGENRRMGPVLCAPRVLAPFEGARIGPTTVPTLRFSENRDAPTYCAAVRAADGSFAQEARLAPIGATELSATWSGDALPALQVYDVRVRACEGECPGIPDEDTRFDGAQAGCTTYSPPRTFVNRPTGDLNGDAYEDFAIGSPADVAHVFVSGEDPVRETYTICGEPYHVVEVRPDPALADCGEIGPAGVGAKFYGIGAAMLDVAFDARSELIVGGANCQRTDGAVVRQGGALFFYDASLGGLGAHVFEGDPNLVVLEVFGLDMEALFRGGARATDLSTLGGELVAGLVRFRLATQTIDASAGAPVLGPPTEVEERAFLVGRGDLDGDGLADLPYRGRVRFTRPAGDDDAFRERILADGQGGNALFLGDREADGNGRAELLTTDGTVDDACAMTWELVELADGAEREAARYDRLDRWTAPIPNLARANCPMSYDAVNDRFTVPECESGLCAPDDTSCPICRTIGLTEGSLAAAMPRGAAWGPEPGPLTVTLRRSGLVARGASGSETTLTTTATISECAGVMMRGNYDLDGDGLNELVVVDPLSNALFVACGDDPDPTLTRVRRDSDFADFEPGGGSFSACIAPWSMAP